MLDNIGYIIGRIMGYLIPILIIWYIINKIRIWKLDKEIKEEKNE